MTEDENDALSFAAERIAGRYAPAYVVVDERFVVRCLSASARRYIAAGVDPIGLSLLRLVHRDFQASLRTALRQAAAGEAAVTLHHVQLDGSGASRRAVDLIVEPLPPGTYPAGYVVLIRESVATGLDGSRAGQLELELSRAREYLQATIEQLQSSNEQLMAANEEHQAANEELQSANAELEASKHELRVANQALTNANSDLKNLLESTQIATILLDEGRRVRSFTTAATSVFHLVPTDVGRLLAHIASRVAYPELDADIARVALTRATVEREIGPQEGPRFHVRVLPYRTLENRIGGTVLTFLDVTETARAQAELMAAEAALRQSQKMEAVGQLTGGIAHDFNNMLQSAISSLELQQRRLKQGRLEEAGRHAEGARQSLDRAAALTHRLLAFARRQALQPRPVNPDVLVRDMAELIRRTAGPGVAVELRLREDTWPVLCDPNQLENALLNLAINARDALVQSSSDASARDVGTMPGDGRLAIGTDHVILGAADVLGQEGAVPGDYVEISVSDTGAGMDEATKVRVFEPFFTTKPIGQGTGLGLSQVYGFVRQSGGIVQLDSAPGQGTTVRLFLPRHRQVNGHADEAVPRSGEALDAADVAGAGITVLLVDDEAYVREVAAEHLRELGYAVLEAADGPAALSVLRDGRGAPVRLLVTDVGLPGGLNGRQLAEAARETKASLPVLFVTGYAAGALGSQLAPGMAVLGKPFTLDALASQVRAMLAPGDCTVPGAPDADLP